VSEEGGEGLCAGDGCGQGRAWGRGRCRCG
jgi:hypothetical protein